MSDKKVTPDWNKIELDYRAGIKSLRQIAGEHGIKSETSIRKRAAKYGWQRDTINDVADELVRKDTVRKQVRSKSVHSQELRTIYDERQDFDISEEETIEENARAIAQVRIAHRRDIARSRNLFTSMIEEIEELSSKDIQENMQSLLNQLLDQGWIDKFDATAVMRTISLNNRIGQLKTLSDSLKTIVALERQAYNMDNVQPIQDPLTSLLQRIANGNSSVEEFDAPLALQTLTFCIITLENGFTVTGESACASPENFNEEIGKEIAFKNAREKIWLLEGYLLKERLYKLEDIQELQTRIDQLLKTRIPILDQIYDVCQAIEKCGASPELTDAVTKAGQLRAPITELVKQAVALGIGEGIVGVSYSSDSKPKLSEPEINDARVKHVYYVNPLAQFEGAIGGLEPLGYKALSSITYCILVLQDGSTVTGMYETHDPDNYGEMIRQNYAYQEAIEKLNRALERSHSPIKCADNLQQVACGESQSSARDERLNNRETAYMLTQLINTPTASKALRTKAENKLSELIDKLN